VGGEGSIKDKRRKAKDKNIARKILPFFPFVFLVSLREKWQKTEDRSRKTEGDGEKGRREIYDL